MKQNKENCLVILDGRQLQNTYHYNEQYVDLNIKEKNSIEIII